MNSNSVRLYYLCMVPRCLDAEVFGTYVRKGAQFIYLFIMILSFLSQSHEHRYEL